MAPDAAYHERIVNNDGLSSRFSLTRCSDRDLEIAAGRRLTGSYPYILG